MITDIMTNFETRRFNVLVTLLLLIGQWPIWHIAAFATGVKLGGMLIFIHPFYYLVLIVCLFLSLTLQRVFLTGRVNIAVWRPIVAFGPMLFWFLFPVIALIL